MFTLLSKYPKFLTMHSLASSRCPEILERKKGLSEKDAVEELKWQLSI